MDSGEDVCQHPPPRAPCGHAVMSSSTERRPRALVSDVTVSDLESSQRLGLQTRWDLSAPRVGGARGGRSSPGIHSRGKIMAGVDSDSPPLGLSPITGSPMTGCIGMDTFNFDKSPMPQEADGMILNPIKTFCPLSTPFVTQFHRPSLTIAHMHCHCTVTNSP